MVTDKYYCTLPHHGADYNAEIKPQSGNNWDYQRQYKEEVTGYTVYQLIQEKDGRCASGKDKTKYRKGHEDYYNKVVYYEIFGFHFLDPPACISA